MGIRQDRSVFDSSDLGPDGLVLLADFYKDLTFQAERKLFFNENIFSEKIKISRFTLLLMFELYNLQ